MGRLFIFMYLYRYIHSLNFRLEVSSAMSLYEQISDEITLMDAGEQKWIGEDLPLEAMVAVELLLQDMAEEKIIKVRRKNREKTSGLKQIDRILIEKL